jgi:hypothetical protein
MPESVAAVAAAGWGVFVHFDKRAPAPCNIDARERWSSGAGLRVPGMARGRAVKNKVKSN